MLIRGTPPVSAITTILTIPEGKSTSLAVDSTGDNATSDQTANSSIGVLTVLNLGIVYSVAGKPIMIEAVAVKHQTVRPRGNLQGSDPQLKGQRM